MVGSVVTCRRVDRPPAIPKRYARQGGSQWNVGAAVPFQEGFGRTAERGFAAAVVQSRGGGVGIK